LLGNKNANVGRSHLFRPSVHAVFDAVFTVVTHNVRSCSQIIAHWMVDYSHSALSAIQRADGYSIGNVYCRKEQHLRITHILTVLLALVLAASGCTAISAADSTDMGSAQAASTENVFRVRAVGLTFDAPDEISSGWTTFRLENESEMTHFAMVQRFPEGKGMADHQAEIAPVFQEGMDFLNDGDVDAAMTAFGSLPAWFAEVIFMGGPGLVAAGESAETTVYLEPGTYVMECYVKTEGIFHSYNPAPDTFGMVHEFTVTDAESGAVEPTADLDVTISSERGIEVEGDVNVGEQVVAVHFADQTVHEHFLGHDVHLARLEDGVDMDALATWVDWTQQTGLETPAPVTFLGGTQDMRAGETAYLTVNLTPGDYAWIAEVPNPSEKGMLEIFTVP
jgi:hypothetical protein